MDLPRSGNEKHNMKLTQRRIETLECPTGRKDMLVFDDEQRGLGVRVTTGGGKSFLLQYRHAGEKRRMPLGSCSAISLAKARLTARQLVGVVAGGKDPASERMAAALQAKRDGLTLDAVIDQWDEATPRREAPELFRPPPWARCADLRQTSGHSRSEPRPRHGCSRARRALPKDGRAAMAARRPDTEARFSVGRSAVDFPQSI